MYAWLDGELAYEGLTPDVHSHLKSCPYFMTSWCVLAGQWSLNGLQLC